jgi:hypothetical protein
MERYFTSSGIASAAQRGDASDSQVACVQEFTIAPDYSVNTPDSTV